MLKHTISDGSFGVFRHKVSCYPCLTYFVSVNFFLTQKIALSILYRPKNWSCILRMEKPEKHLILPPFIHFLF